MKAFESDYIWSCWFSLNWVLVCSCQVLMDGAVTLCQSVDYIPDQSLCGVTSWEGHVSANRRGASVGFLTYLPERQMACLFCFLILWFSLSQFHQLAKIISYLKWSGSSVQLCNKWLVCFTVSIRQSFIK